MSSSNEKILVVDDDYEFLDTVESAWCRQYRVATAISCAEALQVIRDSEPFAVVVVSNEIRDMNGIAFLTSVRDLSPCSARILMDGQDDGRRALDSCDNPAIFEVVPKPCPIEILELVVRSGVRDYRRSLDHEDLTEKAMVSSMRLALQVLGLVHPRALTRAGRVKRLTRSISRLLCNSPNGMQSQGESTTVPGEHDEASQHRMAAVLCQIGCVALPSRIVEQVYDGAPLSENDAQLFQTHPIMGRSLVENIPSLAQVAEIIAYQHKNFDGSGMPPDSTKGNEIPLGSRILKVALDYDLIVSTGRTGAEAVAMMRKRAGRYDPRIIEVLATVIGLTPRFKPLRFECCYVSKEMPLGSTPHAEADSKAATSTKSAPLPNEPSEQDSRNTGVDENRTVLVPISDNIYRPMPAPRQPSSDTVSAADR